MRTFKYLFLTISTDLFIINSLYFKISVEQKQFTDKFSSSSAPIFSQL